MSNYQLPGILCRVLGAFEIDAGTLCRAASKPPTPAGLNQAGTKKTAYSEISKTKFKAKVYSEHFGAVTDPLRLVGDDVIISSDGKAECAKLVRELTNAPATQPKGWEQGTGLSEATVASLEPGTPVATGWIDGFYPNNDTGQHAGIFAGPARDKNGKMIGFTIVEQYPTLTKIKSRTVYFDPVAMKLSDTYFHRGRDYATIKW